MIAIGALAVADLGPFEDPPTDEELAQAAAERFFAAAAGGDSERFCSLLTSDARRTLRINTAQKLRTDEVPSCKRILDTLGGAFAGSAFSIRYVNVSGNQARVEGHYRTGDAPAEPPRTAIGGSAIRARRAISQPRARGRESARLV